MIWVEEEKRRRELTGPTIRAMAEKLRAAAAISCASMTSCAAEGSRGGRGRHGSVSPCCVALFAVFFFSQHQLAD